MTQSYSHHTTVSVQVPRTKEATAVITQNDSNVSASGKYLGFFRKVGLMEGDEVTQRLPGCSTCLPCSPHTSCSREGLPTLIYASGVLFITLTKPLILTPENELIDPGGAGWVYNTR